MLKKLIILPFFITLSYSQLKDLQTQSLKNLRNIVENASRANQKVWLEDFTGIDSPYEIPKDPDLEIDTKNLSIEDSENLLLDFISEKTSNS